VTRLRPISRDDREVLVRQPWLDLVDPRPRPIVDILDQLEELVALLRRGVLSRDEFNRQKRKVLAG
jgi:hypothetical protein